MTPIAAFTTHHSATTPLQVNHTGVFPSVTVSFNLTKGESLSNAVDSIKTASAEIKSVHPSKPVTQLAIRVTRQTDEVVLEGEAWCYTFSPDA